MPVKVSVIMAAYNAEQTLERCVQSLREQTLRDFEILIVNDGSVDGTQRLLDNFCRLDSRIHVFFQKNRGPAAARSLALSHVRGDYLTFVDADDEVCPDYLKKLYERAENTGADLVVCAHTRIKGENRMVYPMSEDTISIGETGLESFLLNRAVKMGHAIWGKLYRAQIIREHALDFFPVRYAEDYIFNLCYYCYCDRLEIISDSLYNYYLYDSSLMANIPEDIVPQITRALKGYNTFVDMRERRDAVGAYYHAVWLQEAFDILNSAFRGGFSGIEICLKKLDASPAFRQHARALHGQSFGRALTIKRTLLTLQPRWLRAVLVWLCMKYLLRNSMR